MRSLGKNTAFKGYKKYIYSKKNYKKTHLRESDMIIQGSAQKETKRSFEYR